MGQVATRGMAEPQGFASQVGLSQLRPMGNGRYTK